MTRITVETTRRTEMIAITDPVRRALEESGVREGICHVYVPHTTAGITINENADPSVVHDILRVIDRLIPFDDPGYRHAEGNSAAHLKAMLTGSSAVVPVRKGRLLLGTWQGIFFCEFDGPRSRHFFVKAIAG
jgi:secondary thiamine-phosphate synthase enzyme